jgi:hypothetical protein
VKNWLGLQDVNPTNWNAMRNVKECGMRRFTSKDNQRRPCVTRNIGLMGNLEGKKCSCFSEQCLHLEYVGDQHKR